MEGYCCEDDEACEVGRTIQDRSKLKVIVVKMMKRVKWAEQYTIALNGRLFSRRPRLFQSCSAVEKEEE